MGYSVTTLNPDDPPDRFPEPANMGVALGYPDGLLAIGGDLSPERLIAAYRRGIFPWFNEDQPILWWCPDPRAVIRPERFHMSRSLERNLKRANWTFTVNNCFNRVIDACATDRGEFGTWITPEMDSAYRRLHEMGFAHSVESWLEGELAGGIYGIRMGNMFFGESMFTRVTDGSKIALSALIHMCLEDDIDMLDCQVSSPHLETLGMEEIPRAEFLAHLEGLETTPAPFRNALTEPASAELLTILARRDST